MGLLIETMDGFKRCRNIEMHTTMIDYKEVIKDFQKTAFDFIPCEQTDVSLPQSSFVPFFFFFSFPFFQVYHISEQAHLLVLL